MKIMIDIGHPAHVHYFRNFINIMESNGHQFLITARDKEVCQSLLDKYRINYISRGEGQKGLFGKFKYTFWADYFLLKKCKEFNPQLLMSFSSPYAAHVSKILGKPHIAFDDTEHATLAHLIYRPFTDVILSPSCYNKKLHRRQVLFDGYMELSYLHSNRFKQDPRILNELDVRQNERYVVLRFVSWNATHDIGQSGISYSEKEKIIKEFSKSTKLFISSEDKLPEEFQKYKLKVSPERIHDVLAFASLFIGEGATMASECACLGTPAIYINSLELGYCTEQEKKYNLIHGFRNSDGIIKMARNLLMHPTSKNEFNIRSKKMLKEKIDVTAFMVWFIENYPESLANLKNDPKKTQEPFYL